jgi:phosphatidylinositol alpha-mannosyltransferase
VIPNGIDVEAYGHASKVPDRVAFLGRDDERKGLQVLLDAWPAVLERVPDAQLHVIGAARDEEVSGVTFVGRVDESVKISELGEAELYCAPNLGGESFGIVIAEGMASGCAIVASAIPAFVGVLGDSGALVAPGDPASLAACISDLLTDRKKLAMKQRSALAAVERFDGASVAGMYVTAYEDAISRHRS